MEQKQLDYYLKSSSGEHEQEYMECMKEILFLVKNRIGPVGQLLSASSLYIGCQHPRTDCPVLERIEQGEKGSVRYLHFSYLLSNALADEMLVKADSVPRLRALSKESSMASFSCS